MKIIILESGDSKSSQTKPKKRSRKRAVSATDSNVRLNTKSFNGPLNSVQMVIKTGNWRHETINRN
jgi:hypothetical protein